MLPALGKHVSAGHASEDAKHGTHHNDVLRSARRADARVLQALAAADHVVEQLADSAVRTDDDVLIRLAHLGRDVADALEAPPQVAVGP